MDVIIAAQFGECSRSEIAEEQEITLKQVDSAFLYYENNKAYIDADIQRHFDNFDRLAKEGYGRPEAKVLSRLTMPVAIARTKIARYRYCNNARFGIARRCG